MSHRIPIDMSQKIPTITFSGIDRLVDLSHLSDLAAPFKGIEFAILFSASNTDNRYLTLEKIQEYLNFNKQNKNPLNFAIHICGRSARDMLTRGLLDEIVLSGMRLQVNGTLRVEELNEICDRFPDNKIITQHNEDNLDLLGIDRRNHQLLVDRFKGHEIEPNIWSRPVSNQRIGFAGGLSPDNVTEHLTTIDRTILHSSEGYWIDVWFDINKMSLVLMRYVTTLHQLGYDIRNIFRS